MRSQQEQVETIDGIGIPKRSKRKIILMIIIMMLGLYSGFLVGSYIISMRSDPNRYNFDVSALIDSVEQVRILSQGKTPQQIGATNLAVLAFDTTFNQEKVFVTGVGSVEAMGTTQSISARTIRVGNNIFTENISIGVVKAMSRFYSDWNEISQYRGSINGDSVVWDTKNVIADDVKTMELYTKKYGVPMNYYMMFIVSSKTVTEASEVTVNADGNYECTLTLDKVKSVINYVKSMKDTGGLADYPDFVEDPKIKLIVDKDYKILRFESEEHYTVKMYGLKVRSNGTLTNTFEYGEDFVIPELSENTPIK